MREWNDVDGPGSSLEVAPFPASVRDALSAIRDSAGYQRLDGPHGEHLRSLIRLLCGFARHDALRAEQLIPTFKQAIAQSAELQGLHPDHRDGIRDAMVQLLIKSFYSDAA